MFLMIFFVSTFRVLDMLVEIFTFCTGYHHILFRIHVGPKTFQHLPFTRKTTLVSCFENALNQTQGTS